MFKPSPPKPDHKRIGDLIIKYLSKDLTPQEAVELAKWVSASKKNKRLFNKFKEPKFLKALIDADYSSIRQELNQLPAKQILFTLNFKKQHGYVSAAILIAVFISIYTLVTFKKIVKRQRLFNIRRSMHQFHLA